MNITMVMVMLIMRLPVVVDDDHGCGGDDYGDDDADNGTSVAYYHTDCDNADAVVGMSDTDHDVDGYVQYMDNE